MAALRRTVARIKRISPGRQIEVLAMFIGLIVDVIALLSYIGVVRTPSDSPLFYVNSQDFLVWALIAAVYSLGFINCQIIRRWRRIYREKNQTRSRYSFLQFDYDSEMFYRYFALALLTSFPLVYLFSRAILVTSFGGSSSPWTALITAVIFAGFAALGMMAVAHGFDVALSLYTGEGNVKEETLRGQ